MSVYNGINEQGLNEVLKRRLNVQEGAPAPACAPEVFPTLALESDRAEWGWLKGERLATGYGSQPAVVANLSAVKISNPPGSRDLIVVTALNIWCQATVNIRRGNGGPLGLLGLSGPTDTRFPAVAPFLNTSAQITTNALPVSTDPTTLYQLQGPLVNYIVPGRWVLAPDGGLTVWTGAANFQLIVAFDFYERRAQPSELG